VKNSSSRIEGEWGRNAQFKAQAMIFEALLTMSNELEEETNDLERQAAALTSASVTYCAPSCPRQQGRQLRPLNYGPTAAGSKNPCPSSE